MTPPARSPQERKKDALHRLETDVDAWISTAGQDVPYLVPLSFLWDGETLLISTPTASPTGRNLLTTGKARIALGPTRDVLLIEATVKALKPSELSQDLGDAFATRTGFDPRDLKSYTYFRLRPHLIQAWREVNELKERDLMRDGQWLVS